MLYLDEIKTEQDLLDVLPDIENEVIEATTAIRGKSQKVKMCSMTIKQVMKKCGINRWKAGKKRIQNMFKALEREAMEYETNMWSL